MNHAVASHSSSSGSPDDAATALRGASLAFQRSPAVGATSPLALLPHHTKDVAAPIDPSKSPYRLSADHTGNGGTAAHTHHADSSVHQAGMLASRLHQLNGSPAQLQTSPAQRLDPKSPSFIAATLAASRSVSPSPLARTPRRRISFGAASALGNTDAVDSESIAPTGNLISMFEKAKADGKTTQKPARLVLPDGAEHTEASGGKRMPAPSPKAKKHVPRAMTPPRDVNEGRSSSVPPKQPPTPPLRSSEKISAMPMPKPKLPEQLTASSRPHAAAPMNAKGTHPAPSPPAPRLSKPAKPTPNPLKVRPPSPPSVISRSSPEVLSPKPRRVMKPTLAPPVLSSPPRGSTSPGSSAQAASSPSPDPEKRSLNTNLRPPTPPKPRGSQKLATSQPESRNRRRKTPDSPLNHSSPSVTPLTEFGLPIVSPSPPQQPPRQERRKKTPPPMPTKRELTYSAPTSPVREASRRHQATTPSRNTNLTLDPLTSAIMASSLASSRLTPHGTGSSLPPPSLPKRQKSPRLLQTLRQPQSYSDEDPERLKIAHRHKLSSNKHAHHEGSRKRWRDQVTQRERKRYEAVWASNRGHLLGGDRPLRADDQHLRRLASECVANVMVREIWKRSRLPEDELFEVWELVDGANDGMLTRQEFVVGMWLVDQRLKGRKLPVKVSDSVWESANGVHISRPPRGK